MVFNATFNNISVISWQSFFGGGNSNWITKRKPPACRKSLAKWHHIMLYRVHLTIIGFELTTLVAIGTDCIVNLTTIRSRP